MIDSRAMITHFLIGVVDFIIQYFYSIVMEILDMGARSKKSVPPHLNSTHLI